EREFRRQILASRGRPGQESSLSKGALRPAVADGDRRGSRHSPELPAAFAARSADLPALWVIPKIATHNRSVLYHNLSFIGRRSATDYRLGMPVKASCARTLRSSGRDQPDLL